MYLVFSKAHVSYHLVFHYIYMPGIFTFTFSHLADAFIQSDLQMRFFATNKIKSLTVCNMKLF